MQDLPTTAMASETERNSSRLVMPHACMSCASRRVRCDRGSPKCSTCVKRGADCVYQRIPPRPRRKRRAESAERKVERYERILSEHGLLENSPPTASESGRTSQAKESRSPDQGQPDAGILIGGQGGTRYIDDRIWVGLGGHAIARGVEEAFAGHRETSDAEAILADPLSATAFTPSHQPLFRFHPAHEEAMYLWKTHLDRVEPICRLLHIPTAAQLILTRSQNPQLLSPAEECLLFAIYHFAVHSLTDDECRRQFPHTERDVLLERFSFATEQALVNVGWLATTDLTVLQAVVLFLLASRHKHDPNSYWILTGVAMRIGQRLGVHRDGERLGMPPFEVELRRRLYYQLLPLDGAASAASGAGITPIPESWDCKPPLNISDANLQPGMTGPLVEQRGATEMMFCLARAHLGSCFLKVSRATASGAGRETVEGIIQQAESEVEDRYIRFCDVVDCLHFQTICFARAAIHAMRLRLRLSKFSFTTASTTEKKEIYGLTQKIMDANIAMHSNAGLRKYLWNARTFAIWGSWESLIFVLNSLCEANMLAGEDREDAWLRIQQLYESRNLCDWRQVLHVAVGRLALKAWEASPPGGWLVEPGFITTIRQSFGSSQNKAHASDAPHEVTDPTASNRALGASVAQQGTLEDVAAGDLDFDFMDWTAWEQMIKNYG
nr:BTG1 [Cercospora sp. JNU001]